VEHLFSEGDVPSHFDFHTQETLFGNEVNVKRNPESEKKSQNVYVEEAHREEEQDENNPERKNFTTQEIENKNKHSVNKLNSGALEEVDNESTKQVASRKESCSRKDDNADHDQENDVSIKPVSRNVTDNGKAWLMPHKVQSKIFESNDTSFDFDSELLKYKEYIEVNLLFFFN